MESYHTSSLSLSFLLWKMRTETKAPLRGRVVQDTFHGHPFRCCLWPTLISQDLGSRALQKGLLASGEGAVGALSTQRLLPDFSLPGGKVHGRVCRLLMG